MLSLNSPHPKHDHLTCNHLTQTAWLWLLPWMVQAQRKSTVWEDKGRVSSVGWERWQLPEQAGSLKQEAGKGGKTCTSAERAGAKAPGQQEKRRPW